MFDHLASSKVALAMLDEVGKFLGELILWVVMDLLVESIRGFFRHARSPRGRWLKLLAWLGLIASITCFAIALRWVEAVLIGLVLMFLAFGISLWASVVNSKSLRGGA